MATPTNQPQGSTTEKFEPDDRQRKVIEEADRLAQQAMADGRQIPPELAQRMQDEQSLASYVLVRRT